jgi:penicillin-binding protein 1A
MNKTRKITKVLWVLFFSGIGLSLLLFLLISLEVFGTMPSFEELENPETNLATEIYTDDGSLLGKFYRENRTVVEFTELSPNVVNALVATEDIRFYEHAGIDAKAIARALFGVMTGSTKGGGSTITQQLAKNLFPRDTTNYSNKISYFANLGITKLKEWMTAVKLEKNYTKQEIITMYLNTVPFGSNAHGIKAAARTFYSASPDSLSQDQAAVLVGLLKAPSFYSPKFNPENALSRRNVVLSQMEKYQEKLKELHGYKIRTEEYYDSLQSLPIELSYSVQSHRTGLAPYFREFLRGYMMKSKPKLSEGVAVGSFAYHYYLQDSIDWENDPLMGWCHKNKKPDGSMYNLYTDGIKIYTTINEDMQNYAEKAVEKHLGEYLQPLFFKHKKGKRNAPFSWKLTKKQIDKILYASVRRSERYRVLRLAGKDSAEIMESFNTPTQMRVFTWEGEKDTTMTPMDSIVYYKYFLRAGLMSMDPNSGHVKAYVGGPSYSHFRYDHVNQARRQVGSTIKPIVYSVAMEDGLSPCHKVPNIEVNFEMPPGQKPEIYTPRYSANKREGDMVSLKYGLALSLNQISAWVMKKYGPLEIVKMAKRTGIKSPLDTVYALCVGAAETKVSEMVAAFGTYANKGMHTEPVYVTRIEDRNGNIISKFSARKKETLNANTAYRMIDLLRGVVDIGTSTKLRYQFGLTNEIAGKTGTTNDNSDGWFIGMVPNLVTGVWVGGETRSIRFDIGAYGQGSSMALPIWGYYMKSVYGNKDLGISKDPFQKPENYDGVIMDCNEYNKQQENANRLFAPEEEIF